MITTLKEYPNESNIVALQVSGGFTNADMQVFADAFQEKLNQGHKQVNIIITLDQLDTLKSSLIATLKERIWGIKNNQKMGKIAIVANKRKCDWLKRAILLEAWLLMKINPKAEERYYDISDLEKAFAFVEER